MTSSNDISLEHIDPLNSDHVCGLRVVSNEVLALGSYNYAKSNKFVPYRLIGNSTYHENPGDVNLFLINGEWVECEFFGDEWHAEARRIGCGSTKNRSLCNPQHASRISSIGGKAAVKAGYHYNANGCHTSERQRARVLGKKFWYNPVTDHCTRALESPGPEYEQRRRPRRK